MEQYCIYHIGINPDLNTGYIGISKNPNIRFSQHFYKNNSNKHLSNAIKKYGKDVFKRVLLSNLNKELAELCEEMLRPEPNMGWNIAKGGGIPPSPKGKPRDKEYCENISKAKLGIKNPMYGKKVTFSEEHRKNLSKAIKGRRNKFKGIPKEIVECPHCGKKGGGGSMKQWHFDRCKNANK
jgi:group I intron endonuclease